MTRDEALAKAQELSYYAVEQDIRRIAAALLRAYADGTMWGVAMNPTYEERLATMRRIREDASRLERGE